MKTLAEDYEREQLTSKNIRSYMDANFSVFHEGRYDREDHPIEIVGLILGYPIENTISLIEYS